MPPNPIYCFAERARARVRGMLGTTLTVLAIDQNRAATRGRAGIYVAPAVTDQETGGKIDALLFRGLE